MKYSIIGLFTIFTLLASVRADECIPIPQVMVDSVVACADDVTSENLRTLFSEDPGTSDPDCYAACVYGNSGYFRDGKFSKEFIESFLRKYVIHPSIERLVELSLKLADNANAVEGDYCAKAFEFFIMNDAIELRRLQEKILCPPVLPQKFIERIEGMTENDVYFPEMDELQNNTIWNEIET